MRTLDELKKDVFYRFLDLVGRAYIHVRHSGSVRLGRRGFVGDERHRGIVLVMNSKMKFSWDDEGISATLLFGASREKCFIPVDDIIAIYSPELGAQLLFTPDSDLAEGDYPDKKGEADGNLIKVDFSKGR